jgi:hypothetical protein
MWPDPKVRNLAEHVLQHEPYTTATATRHEDRVRSLSEEIQQAVEAWTAAHPTPLRDLGPYPPSPPNTKIRKGG